MPTPDPVHCYQPLGYPLRDLPPPEEPVTSLDVYNVVVPLLEGICGLLIGLEQAFSHRALTEEKAHAACALLTGQVQTALHIFKR